MPKPHTRSLARCTLSHRLLSLCLGSMLTVAAGAQDVGVIREPDRPTAVVEGVEPSPALLQALGQPYLSEAEKSAKRIFHGLWTTSDLAIPASRARAALIAGVFDDPSLSDPAVPAEDRAEAQVERGEPAEALATLDGAESVRAARLRALALESLGRYDDAKAAISPIVLAMSSRKAQDAAELTEGIEAVRLLARLEGRPADDYQRMLDLLVSAQQEMDRFYWPAILAQAELLYEKDNSGEARKAAIEVLLLNSTSARAWALMGQLGVDAFNFPAAEQAAGKLDQITRRIGDDQSRHHPYGDMILARAWMRQNDAAYARKYTSRALESAPRMREALALDIAAVALTFDYDQAAKMLADFDALSPGSPLAYYEAGKALSESRQYHKAAELLNEAVRRQPKWPQPSLELGLLEMQSGRDTLALTALRRAVELDPFNIRARNSLALVEDLAKYATFETENFIIRSRAGVDEVMAREMGPILEEIHKHDMAHVDFKPPQKTVIELHPDHKTFAVRITGMTGIHTIAASTGPVIAMEAPKVGKEHKGPYDWVRVLRHEYVHTLTLARTNNRIPHWFTEASAVYLEGAPRDYNTVQMLTEAVETGSLFDLVEINVAFVRPKKPMDRGKAYAQGHWMYQYIVYRWGERVPLDLMDLYRDGIREAEAMQRVLGIDSAQFLKDFEAWARQDAMSWGMLAQPSIPALMLEATLADPDRRAGIEAQIARFASGVAVALEGGVMPEWKPIRPVEPDMQATDLLLAKHPDHPDLLELKCQLVLKAASGKPDESMVPLLERYAKARPVDPMPHQHLARLFLASDDPSRAIPHLAYLDVREQYSPVYAIELARQSAAQGDWDAAGLKAERATQISPFDANFREFAASVAIQRGDLATAERHIQALVDLEPTRDVHQKRLDRIRQMRQEAK